MRKMGVFVLLCTFILTLGGIAGAAEIEGKYVFGDTDYNWGEDFKAESDSQEFVFTLTTPLAGNFDLVGQVGFGDSDDYTVNDSDEIPELSGEADSWYVGTKYNFNEYLAFGAGYTGSEKEITFDFPEPPYVFGAGLEGVTFGQKAEGWKLGADFQYPVTDKLTLKAAVGYAPSLKVRPSIGIDVALEEPQYYAETQMQVSSIAPPEIDFDGSPDYSITFVEQTGSAIDWDLGIAYAFNPELSLTAGYRCSKLTTEFDNGFLGYLEETEEIDDLVIETSGFYVGLAYAF